MRKQLTAPLLIFLTGSIGLAVAGEVTAASGADATKRPAIQVSGVDLATRVHEPAPDANAAPQPVVVSLGDSLVVRTRTADELRDYLQYAAAESKPVTLFLDGNDTGLRPEAVDIGVAAMRFHLERNADNKNVWAALLRYPFFVPSRAVRASIGIAGQMPEPAEKATFTLKIVNWAWYAYAWVVLLAVLTGYFFWLAARRDLLRDGPKPNPYSLGRCQMAWWFLLILYGYVMIWLISGDQDTITESLLVLMGISAGTGLGSILINSATGDAAINQAASDRLALQAAQQLAQQAVATAQAAVTATPTDPVTQKQLADAQASLAVVTGKLNAVNALLLGLAIPPQTRGFVRDILSDSQGNAALHRFQIVAWTIVLGIVFMVSVTTELTMPAFSPTLLTLMGISAGTYLGFKFPEK